MLEENQIVIDINIEKNNVISLLHTAYILREKSEKLGKNSISNETGQFFNSSLQYSERFISKYGYNTDKEALSNKLVSITKLFQNYDNLNDVEKPLLTNLLPLQAEEAFELIPTLKEK